jgi:AraC-like DNA-binding protein
MDVLSDVLGAVRLTGALFFDVDASSPWVVETPKMDNVGYAIMPEVENVIAFHVIMDGESWVEVHDGVTPAVRVKAGDVLVFARGDAHTFSSIRGARAADPGPEMYRRPADHRLPFVVHSGGGGPERTRLICGYLGYDATPFNPLIAALPAMIYAPGPAAEASWVAQLLRLAVDETGTRRAGGETVLAKLSELMFVEIVRRYIDGLPEDSPGWLSGLRDRHVGAALSLMHGRPAEPWTLDSLAREIGMSRTTFTERFTQYVGDSPMHYLGRWRLQVAAGLLERQGMNIAQAAAEVGYESEAAFNRAFKKEVGVPPGAWRRGRAAPASTGSSALV